MQKQMKIMLLGVGLLFGGIFIYKSLIGYMIQCHVSNNKNPVVTVSTMTVNYANWQPILKASGSLRAIKGVNVTTELAGMVERIDFKPGDTVKEGIILVQLNAQAEIGQLHALAAQAKLAEITYHRDKAQYAIHAVSKQTLDTDFQTLKNLQGQVEQQSAIVAKKSIRAPFAGRLGINHVNPGQFINTGDKIVSLQTLDPIYVDFFIPQQQINQIKLGQTVTITSDTYPHQLFKGKITTIDSAIGTNTRNVEVEATIANLTGELIPGMFSKVEINTGAPHPYLTLPQTAITYNPYGNLVYVVRQAGKDKKGHPILIAKQAFVETGDTRGDQIAILKGLKKGDMIVSSGQLKLKNGSLIAINNAVVPSNNPSPKTSNEHD